VAVKISHHEVAADRVSRKAKAALDPGDLHDVDGQA
jgi:hypothetical protein